MKKLLLKIKAFYVKDFLFIKNSQRITFKMGVTMIILENLQMLSVYTNSLNTIWFDRFPNKVQSLINYFKIYSLIGDSITTRIICVMVVMLIKTIIFFGLLFMVLQQNLFLKQRLTLQELPLNQKKQNYYFEKCWKSTMTSWYMQINLEILQVPIIFCAVSLITDMLSLKSLNEFQQVGMLLSFIIIILQLLVGLFLHFHQADYRIKNYDILGKVQNLENNIIYALRLLQKFAFYYLSIIFLSGTQQNSLVIQIFGLVITIAQGIQNYRTPIYIDYRIINITCQINSLMMIYQTILILCEFGYPTIRISGSLIILLFYPFILILNHQLQIRQEWKNELLDQRQFIRKLYWNAKLQVQSKKRQQYLEQRQIFQIFTVVRNHLQECKQMRIRKMLKNSNFKQKCFCSTFVNQKDSFQTLDQCKEFLKLLLGQILEDEIKEDNNVQRTISYISYLTEVKKAPISAIYEVIRVSTLEKIPLRLQSIIHRLQQDALQKFYQLIKKQNLVNQMFDFKKAYLFEESLKILKQNLYLIVKQEIEFYEALFCPIIDAQVLQEKGMLLVTNINHLENQIQVSFKTNPQNGECDTIYKLFQKYVNYNKIRPKLYRREGKLMAEFIQSTDKIIYDQNSCVVQITLLQPRGNVIRYTRSFQQVVQCKDDEIMDQNIKKFIPSIIANDHDLYLNNFVETGRINVLKRELRIILVKLKSQFVIPINTRLRIEVNPFEFGAQALMTPVNYSYGYLMLNEQGQIEEITKNLYEDIFKQYLGLELDYVRGLDFLLMIPDLSKIWSSLFDENFEKLDYYLEGQLLIPVVDKQIVSPIQQLNYGNKLLFNKRLQDYMRNNSQNLIKYQINFHLTSLTTINLRVVIVEIPEYKQSINKQYASQLELIQIQPVQTKKTSMNITYQSELPTHKSYGLNSPLNTPPPTKTLMNEYDLEYDNLIEEKKMIEEFRNQLASVTMNNTIQNNSKEPLMQQQQQQCENVSETKIIMPKHVMSYKSDEYEQREFQQPDLQKQQQYNGSVGSRSSQNNSNTFRLQIKDCLQNNKGLNFRIKAFLLLFYSILLTGYILNFCILYFNFERIDKNLNFENLPYQFSYYYNEFIISNIYKQQKEFQFDDLCKISIDYYKQHQKYIDEAASLMPQLNTQNDLTMQRRTINILQQMSDVYDANKTISLQEYLNNSNAFHDLLDKFQATDSPSQISSLLSYFILEEIALFLLLSSYAYFYVSILKMKITFYKLFCTLSKEFVKDQFIQFHSLYNQINHAKFKTNETNEESFEASMVNQFQKNINQGNLESQVRIGKQISTPQININLIFFSLMMLMLTAFSSSYFFGTYLLQNEILSQIEANFVERTYYEETANHLIFAYSHQAFFYNKPITQEMLQYQNKVAAELKSLITKISLESDQSNSVIKKIFLEEVCSVFQDGIVLQDINYQKLFSYEACQSIPSLQKGLIYASQELFSLYYDIFQDTQYININETNKFDKLMQANIQKERLYSQFSFQIVIELLQKEIKDLISQTIYLNTLMFVFANILASITLLIAKVMIENAQQQYSDNKKILTLFPYERLMENAYVHSFITQDLRFLV